MVFISSKPILAKENSLNEFKKTNPIATNLLSISNDLFSHKYFILTTRVDLSQIENWKSELEKGENPKNIKLKLAKEIVKMA